MRSLKRLTKGILISLMLIMLLNTGLRLGFGLNDTFSPTVVYAQEEAEETNGGTDEDPVASLPEQEQPTNPAAIKKIVDGVTNLAHFSHRIFAPLINFLSFQIGNLLGNDYLYHGALGDMIHKLWVISRNLVNIVFVFLLLMLALKTIFSPSFALDDLKKKLIIFTLVLVGVNFSWLGAKVVLDAANVVTHVVFAIPSGIGTDTSLPQCDVNDEHTGFAGACVPTAIYGPVTSDGAPFYYQGDDCSSIQAAEERAHNEDGSTNDQANETDKKVQQRTIFCMENLNLIKYNQNTAVIYMTYGMTRIQNLVYSTKNAGIDGLTVGVLMSFLLQLVFVVSLIALFIALIVRMVMLWVFVGFSPFLVLMLYFKGDDKNPLEQLSGKFDIDTFFKWAFVPAKLGAVFVASFMMITAGQSIGDYKLTLFDNLNEKAGIVNRILEPEALFAGAGSLQSFIWLLMSVVIMWLGVFAVLQDMPIVGTITQKIKGYGDSLAGLVATLPYKAPILPLGEGGEKKSVKELLGPLDMRGRLRTYTGEEGATDSEVRTVVSKADSSGAKKAFAEAKARDFQFANPAQANAFARAFGLELDRFLKLNRTTQVAAIKKAGGDESEANRIINALEQNKRESAVEKSRRREERTEDTAKGTAQGLRQAGAGPQAQPTSTPPVAPPPGATPASSPGTSTGAKSSGTE